MLRKISYFFLGAESYSDAPLQTSRKQGLKKGIKKGIAEDSRTKAIETASNLKRMGMSYAQISEATGLSLEEIQKL
ncbi:MAG: hypothetical protein II707_10025, partial [Spirochaetales bacterium]|nr:hypothetical protein [Spirochaetales bacterium]